MAADGWGESSRHMTVKGQLPARLLGAAILEAELPVAGARGSALASLLLGNRRPRPAPSTSSAAAAKLLPTDVPRHQRPAGE